MKFLIVEDNHITNIIVADEKYADAVGAFPWYEGALIGDTYDPPTLDKLQAATADLAEMVANMLYQQDLNNLGGTTK